MTKYVYVAENTKMAEPLGLNQSSEATDGG